MSTPPQHKVGFRAGLSWLPTGAELLAKHWRPLLGVASLWLLISLLASLVPVVGQLTLMVLTPLLTAGLLAAFDQTRAGHVEVRPGTLFAGWNPPERRLSLIVLGIVSLLGTFLAALVFVGVLTSQIEPALLEANLEDPEALAALLSESSLGSGLFFAILLFLLILAGLFFAVPMVMFGRLGVGAALGYSYRACFGNIGAMVGLLLALIAFGLALGFVLLLSISTLGLALGTAGQFLGQLIMVAATLFTQIVLTGAQYVAFCQVSGWTPGPDEKEAVDDNILA
ncbi:MAG: BPSS1780 family membrane protein [Pseudomonadota bacterium]